MSKRIVAIDSQRLDAMQSCMYLYNLKFNEHWRQIVKPHFLLSGSLMHDIFKQYYKLRIYRNRWHQNRKTHADIVDICLNTGRLLANRMDISISDIEKTIGVCRDYFEFWENDSWDNIRAVEEVGGKILYDSEDLCILYEVKIDLVIHDNGRDTPVDHKHAGQRRDPNELSNQFKGYCWFLDTNYIIINEVGFQKTVPAKDKFRRHLIQYSQAMIDEWVANTVQWVKHTIWCDDNKIYPQNFTSCDKYSGCDFKEPVCGKDPELRPYKLREIFQIEEWSPGGHHL